MPNAVDLKLNIIAKSAIFLHFKKVSSNSYTRLEGNSFKGIVSDPSEYPIHDSDALSKSFPNKTFQMGYYSPNSCQQKSYSHAPFFTDFAHCVFEWLVFIASR